MTPYFIVGGGLVVVGLVIMLLGAAVSPPGMVKTGLAGSYPIVEVQRQGWTETPAEVIKRTALSEKRFEHVAVDVSELGGELMVTLSGPVETDNDVFDARLNVFIRSAPAMRKKIGGVWIGGLSPRVPSVSQTWDRAPGVPGQQTPLGWDRTPGPSQTKAPLQFPDPGWDRR